MIEIIPAIIPQNLNFVREQLSRIVGITKKVQLDIVDGHYASNITWPFLGDQSEERIRIVRGEEKFPFIDELMLEVDMMVFHPIEYIPDFLSIGAKSFVIHVDSTDHVSECIETIKSAGCEVGLGIKPSVDESLLQPFILEADFVQFMGNDRIGHNGVGLDEKVLGKIENFHAGHPSIALQVDIGVNAGTIPALKSAGISRFVSSSAIFTATNIKEAIEQLSNL